MHSLKKNTCKFTLNKNILSELDTSANSSVKFWSSVEVLSCRNKDIMIMKRLLSRSVAKFLVPDWGDIVDSGIGLSRRYTGPPGRYDNSVPELTLSPLSQRLRIWLQFFQNVRYTVQSNLANRGTGRNRGSWRHLQEEGRRGLLQQMLPRGRRGHRFFIKRWRESSSNQQKGELHQPGKGSLGGGGGEGPLKGLGLGHKI